MWKELFELLQTPYGWLIFGLTTAAYIYKNFELPQLSQWVLGRHKGKLALVSEQLKNAENLSSETRHNLLCMREALLFQVTHGIKANAHLAKALMAISENQLNGIEWDTLRLAHPYLQFDTNGKLVVKVMKWYDWLFSLFWLLIGIIFCFYGWFFFAVVTMVEPYNLVRSILGLLASCLYCFIGLRCFRPLQQVLAAREVSQHLSKQALLNTPAQAHASVAEAPEIASQSSVVHD